MRVLRIPNLVVAVLLMSGCSQLTVTKIKPGQEDGGLAYCLLVPKLQVLTKQALVYDKADFDTPPYSRAARPVTEQTVSLVQVPSYDHYYTVKVKSGWFTSDSYSIGYDNNGCLNSYTFTTVDQTANVIATLGSIALAAAAVAAAEAPGVAYPEPSADTYLLDRSSRKLLDLSEAKIKELQTRIQTLLDKGTTMTPQDKQDVDKLRDELANILDKAAKLRSALEPTPTRIIKTEYANLFFVPYSESADKYIVQLLQEAEKGNANNVIPRDQSGGQVDDFVIGIARRIK